MSLHYYAGDYVGACDDAGQLAGLEVEQQYGGALQAISWHSPSEEHQTKAYAYAYDAKYQLKESRWGEVKLQSNGEYGFTSSNSFTESIQSYDAHGNIEGLTRTGKEGSLIANYGYYDYKTGNNQLLNIRSSQKSPVNLRKYEYNKTGQLISEQQQAGQSKYLQYDAYGQVIAVYADAAHSQPIVQYAYNDQGYQVLKKHYNEQGQPEKDTWYVRDASGSVLSIYEEDIAAKQSLSPVEYPVYAQGRLGMLSTRGSDEVYQYELSDHLGNVRVVISRDRKSDGSIDVLHYRDYYSFGSVIEDNSRALGSYRYGYQGLYSEEDEKTSWHSFELRQYDSDIGRWNSIDPYGQYHSPYVAMGNAPNMMVDMDGGWSWTTAAIGAAVGAGVGYVVSGGDWRYAVAGGLAGGALGGASFGKSDKTLYFTGDDVMQSRTVSKLGLSKFGEGFIRTSLDVATLGSRSLLEANNPRIYFNISDYGKSEGFDKDTYYNHVRNILNENNFNSNIEFKDYSAWNNFLSWWNNDTYATVNLRKPSGVKETKYYGGHAVPYSNNATVLYKYNTYFDYANVTVHELGHAIFGFKDIYNDELNDNLMFFKVQRGQKLRFNSDQRNVINSTPWGR